MEENKIVQHFEGKTIFITVFLEKILRVQPNVKKIFLLIRETPKRSVEQRLQEEVVDIELFRVLREKWGEEDFNSILLPKIIPVSGDVSHENLGIVNSELREEMWREIDIIVNSAATTKFDERYDVAFGINVLGAIHVQDFARKCPKLEMLLHVSTAYVHGTRAGLIQEKPLHMGETLAGSEIPILDMDEEKKIIEERLKGIQTQKLTDKDISRVMKDLGVERAMLHGWPNTYVFTKAMGEMVLEKFKEKVNVVIIRPTIITSTYKEPFPGWIEGLRTLDSIFVAYGKGKLKFFVGDPQSTLDMVLKLINIMFCNYFEILYTNARRKINHALRLAELYKPYLFSQAIFDDANTENLRMTIQGNNMNMDMLNFDPKSIQWDEYFVKTHFMGIAKFVLND
ncbi:hypothetical protein DH2020_027958 [Rehmannia glutinosa]|uniref:Fatty acyl-CoA reductase n=1 Tax=Rehmannia glutinosa TaxID=99300 RepID=A0ABR0VWF5_REHGL